jgi:hypothetical protein
MQVVDIEREEIQKAEFAGDLERICGGSGRNAAVRILERD